jgi:RNA polymerase sigma-70 factor, ECF subfamily
VGLSGQDEQYLEAARRFGQALDRLARAYEANPEDRRDLLQEIHLALWRSFAGFDGRCSVRTWVYRVAHNTATSHAIRRRDRLPLATLAEIADAPDPAGGSEAADERVSLERLMTLIRRLKPPGCQLILLYLEGLDAVEIACQD